MKSAARPIFSAAKGRLYSAQAAAKHAESNAAQLHSRDAQVSHLKNGITVASIETGAPVSHVAMVYNAGSRYETHDNHGITHCLRHATNCKSSRTSGFAFTRNIQQMGGNVTAETTREQAIYTLSILRDHVPEGLKWLGKAISFPEFRPWEVMDLNSFIEHDLAVLNVRPDIQLVEALHLAAYRNSGLGNSLYMDPHEVGTHSHTMCDAFVNGHMNAGNVAIVGVGVDHEALTHAAEHGFGHIAKGGAGKAPVSKYHGGEVRINVPGMDLVHASICTEGAAIGGKDTVVLAVLQAAMGIGPHVPYGGQTVSTVAHAATSAAKKEVAANCMNMNYTDSGLFGFNVVAPADEIGNVLSAVRATFVKASKDGISAKDLERGKAMMKGGIFMNMEVSDHVIHAIGIDTLLRGKVHSQSEVAAEIDAVKLEQVNALAKKVIAGKASMATIGDLYNTPYLDDLK